MKPDREFLLVESLSRSDTHYVYLRTKVESIVFDHLTFLTI